MMFSPDCVHQGLYTLLTPNLPAVYIITTTFPYVVYSVYSIQSKHRDKTEPKFNS